MIRVLVREVFFWKIYSNPLHCLLRGQSMNRCTGMIVYTPAIFGLVLVLRRYP
jgi:hypothetical protein